MAKIIAVYYGKNTISNNGNGQISNIGGQLSHLRVQHNNFHFLRFINQEIISSRVSYSKQQGYYKGRCHVVRLANGKLTRISQNQMLAGVLP